MEPFNVATAQVARLAVRLFLLVWVVFLFAFGGVTAGSSAATVFEGEGVIVCEISTAYNTHLDCNRHPSRYDVQPEMIPAGEYNRVTLTISWVPDFQESALLKIDLYANPEYDIWGNPSCGLMGEREGCYHEVVQGPSPLTVNFTGEAVRGRTIVGQVGVADVCGRSDTWLPCDTLPYRFAEEQGFHYTWTLE